MIDPDAALDRRAWIRCPYCREDSCTACAAGTSCSRHWRYLLASEARMVFVQCPRCCHRWWYDTGCGVGDRRPWLYELPDFPLSPGEAA